MNQRRRSTGRSGPDHLHRLFAEYRMHGDVERRNRLVLEYSWLADRCAHRYRERGEPLDDLKQVARLGLLKAVERFDPDYGATFTQFATPTINGEIKRHFRDRTWPVGVPRVVKERRSHVHRAEESLLQRLGRSPREAEIAEQAGVDHACVSEVGHANRSYRTATFDLRLHDVALEHDADAPQLRAVEGVDALSAVNLLGRRDRAVFFLRYWEDRTQGEIAELAGVSQPQVSRILQAGLDRLRRRSAIAVTP